MSQSAPQNGARPRSLPGATVLQIVPVLNEADVARAAVDVARALLRSGTRAIIAGRDGPLVSELQNSGAEWVHLDTTTANPLRLRANGRVIRDLVASERIDVIHARCRSALLSTSPFRPKSPAWLVASEIHPLAQPLRTDRRTARAVRMVDRLVAPSRFLARAFVEECGISETQITVIPLRIDTARFDPSAVSRERAAVLRRSWKVMPDERLILVPGRIDPVKGQLTLVETVRILVNGGMRKTVFILAGDAHAHPDYVRAIRERAKAQGVAHLIRLIGACSDMPAAYVAVDFVALPAAEPPSIAVSAAEALAMARPVIASRIGALPEIVLGPPSASESVRTGWLTPPDDPFALAQAVASALAVDANAYRDISRRARHLAETQFTPTHIAAGTLAVYTSLLEGRG